MALALSLDYDTWQHHCGTFLAECPAARALHCTRVSLEGPSSFRLGLVVPAQSGWIVVALQGDLLIEADVEDPPTPSWGFHQHIPLRLRSHNWQACSPGPLPHRLSSVAPAVCLIFSEKGASPSPSRTPEQLSVPPLTRPAAPTPRAHWDSANHTHVHLGDHFYLVLCWGPHKVTVPAGPSPSASDSSALVSWFQARAPTGWSYALPYTPDLTATDAVRISQACTDLLLPIGLHRAPYNAFVHLVSNLLIPSAAIPGTPEITSLWKAALRHSYAPLCDHPDGITENDTNRRVTSLRRAQDGAYYPVINHHPKSVSLELSVHLAHALAAPPRPDPDDPERRIIVLSEKWEEPHNPTHHKISFETLFRYYGTPLDIWPTVPTIAALANLINNKTLQFRGGHRGASAVKRRNFTRGTTADGCLALVCWSFDPTSPPLPAGGSRAPFQAECRAVYNLISSASATAVASLQCQIRRERALAPAAPHSHRLGPATGVLFPSIEGLRRHGGRWPPPPLPVPRRGPCQAPRLGNGPPRRRLLPRDLLHPRG